MLGLRKKKQEIGEDEFRIEENGSERVLKYGNITYSKLKGDGTYTGEYWDYFIPVAYAFPSPRVLLIGLGGGTVAFQLSTLLREKISLDVVELSKRVVGLSQEFAPNTNANIVIGEGSTYVATTNKRYDAILLDAYVSSRIPEQFLQRRFIEDAYRALSEDGVLAINFAMTLMGALKFSEYVSKLKERFRVFKVNTAMFEGNVIIVCSKKLSRNELLDRISTNMPQGKENESLMRNYARMEAL